MSPLEELSFEKKIGKRCIAIPILAVFSTEPTKFDVALPGSSFQNFQQFISAFRKL